MKLDSQVLTLYYWQQQSPRSWRCRFWMRHARRSRLQTKFQCSAPAVMLHAAALAEGVSATYEVGRVLLNRKHTMMVMMMDVWWWWWYDDTVIYSYDDMMIGWWNDDMTIWRYDNMMIWWCDDMRWCWAEARVHIYSATDLLGHESVFSEGRPHPRLNVHRAN